MRKALSTLTEEEFRKIQHQLRSENSLGFKVATGSMLPVIPVGAPIVVEKITTPPKKFDILVFFDGSLLICHFLWHVNTHPDSDGNVIYVTCGLSNWPDEDLPVPSNRILGRVVSHQLGRGTKARLILKALFRRFSRL
jgi:signal peptidase I